jgi:hypothetical protein
MPGKKPDPEPQDNHDWHHHTPSSGLTCRACDLAHKFWTGGSCPLAPTGPDKCSGCRYVPCGNCFEAAAKIVEECDTDPGTQFAAETLREKAVELRTAPPKPSPCSDPPCGYEKDELCDTHATEKAHAEGDHQWCDITCQDNLTWEMLRNGILWRAAPGSPKMLDELLRRATNRSALMEAHIALVSTLSQIRAAYDTLKTEHDEMAARLEGLEK